MKTSAPARRMPTTRRAVLVMAAVAGAALAVSPGLRAADAAGAAPKTTVSIRLPADPLQVQINQVALERVGPKKAIVESTGAAETGRYRVLADGKVVAQGELAALPAFSAWGEGRRYFEVDFSSLQRPGVYRVEATVGGKRVLSPAVRVRDRALFTTIADKTLDYFHRGRHTGAGDRSIRIFETDRRVDVHGGWKDAGGDTGKYLSHLGYANHFNPQQTSMVAWVLAYTAQTAPALYRRAGLERRAQDEAFWGADYLHRILDAEGYFYTTVFDKWGTDGAERMVVGYEGEDGKYTTLYRSAYRAGGGLAIAALARASMLAKQSGRHGEVDGATYLADAIRAFDHLQKFNAQYGADKTENLIDDYAALMAAVDLFEATREPRFLEAARDRADRLQARQAADGNFISDGQSRPYYHAVEAGFPALSLSRYLTVETDGARRTRAGAAIKSALERELAITRRVSNPFEYARQSFQLAPEGKATGPVREGFFIPHKNETGYWWQGESARLASLSAAMVVGGRLVAPASDAAFGIPADWAGYAQSQIDWTLGRNPYAMSMLYGFGRRNPPAVPSSAGDMFVGGISNGITGAADSDTGEGIAFGPGPDDAQWRWVEQWIPHSAWMLLAATEMAR
ncbi:glycoside hydrolase family 9 protein [Mitsuaria sp. GD03876]|uniref:glycoside hydrolase family 9 protein n=1 Tax=Mitsuaria sp. GD03876 TaxID=2975399 RepID=UPI0024484ED5|nr:glycoside hydrolase family 9 protein [Mitsuaria sp. GD03876]MDH0863996.1 glycoside hydrolase family 9 protein [Mitsuaria sp. GD03876]